jgi:DNA repair photolyase
MSGQMSVELPIRGRGASENPANRFVPIAFERDGDFLDADGEQPLPSTQFYKDTTRTILAHNTSPDVGFTTSINPYRGCEHGCSYCYARPTHEYFGLSLGLDFETKIFVKGDAPELLRKELSAKSWKPEVISISGVTDPYQPVERRMRVTRGCIEVLAEFRNPLAIVTKNCLVTRDGDLLGEMARSFNAAAVFVSVTSLDPELTRVMEPRTSVPRKRLEAIEILSRAGVPVGLMVAPIIPGLTDHEMPSILEAAAKAGARTAGYVPVRLPFGVKDLFEKWLEQHFPDRKDKVLNRIRELRGGKLNDSNFESRMRGEGVWAEQFRTMFAIAKRKAGLNADFRALSTASFRRPQGPQLTMFD